ncbi:MAG: ChbG/HpnK family deacetylase [Pseudomonadales bacterium]|nr:ChbG/HpnK family deacetylase [Pseudomonadales bacterium]
MNAFLEKMGFSASDKVLITHIDDIGFSHAANVASFACLDTGAATTGSIIVNAPWFQEAAQICRQHPEYDVGVHLTLTCEYETFRWPALSSRDPKTGLLDEQGCLWRTREDAVRNVLADAAEAEMRAQIETALESGIDVTHIDTHMGSVVHPKFLASYLKLAREFSVPAFLPNITRERLEQLSEGEMAEAYLEALEQVEAEQVPTLDEILIDTLLPMDDKKAFYRELIEGIKPGLTHLLFHPAKMGEELEAITAESCASRNADYEAWTDPSLRTFIEESGAKLIGYRQLREHLG